MKYDLHMHSNCSDGELNPQNLITLAAENSITTCALTDHDTLSGLKQAQITATHHAIQFINGIELSTVWNGQSIHLLGLNIDPLNDQLQAGVASNQQRRTQRANTMFELFFEQGIDLYALVNRQLPINGVPTRPHFASALVKLGKAKNSKQAFRNYLTRGKLGYVATPWPTIGEVTNWIVAAGGVAVLAHPLSYKLTRTKLKRLLNLLTEKGVQGIEVSTAHSNQKQIESIARLATNHNMFASIGSDFHSTQQSWRKIGSARPLPRSVTPIWNLF